MKDFLHFRLFRLLMSAGKTPFGRAFGRMLWPYHTFCLSRVIGVIGVLFGMHCASLKLSSLQR